MLDDPDTSKASVFLAALSEVETVCSVSFSKVTVSQPFMLKWLRGACLMVNPEKLYAQ